MSAWTLIEQQLDAILERRWYTNHGPVAQALEAACADVFEARHAIVVTNPTIGLIMLIEALGLAGDVLVSAFAPARCAQAIAWAGLAPDVYDADPGCGPSTLALLAASIRPRTAALLCSTGMDPAGCAHLAARRGLAFIGDGVAGRWGPRMVPLPGFGDDARIACLLSDDDRLAARLRNIRSSYGAGPPVPVKRTANGRVSEAQAAMALLMLNEAAASEHAQGFARRSFPMLHGGCGGEADRGGAGPVGASGLLHHASHGPHPPLSGGGDIPSSTDPVCEGYRAGVPARSSTMLEVQ